MWPIGRGGEAKREPSVGEVPKTRARRRNLRLALALVLLSPLVGEYLLGNTPITELAALLLFAPMYGAGALLIRETARRTGRGWPAMILFAAAYALLEEGPIDMMLWNPHYGGEDLAAAYPGTAIPFLDTSGLLLQDVFAVHTIWSISVPIAIMETFSADPARPWLGRKGLTVTAVIFVLATPLLSAMQIAESKFVATSVELAWCTVAIVALIVAGLVAGRRTAARRAATAPRPWIVGVTAFTLTTLYFLRDSLPGSRWLTVAAGCALFAVGAVLCVRWSRSRGWDAAHRLAVAGGALLTYVWVGLLNSGNPIFGIGAIVLLFIAARRVRKTVRDERLVEYANGL